MNQEDAEKTLVSWLRSTMKSGRTAYGYDLYLPGVVSNCAQRIWQAEPSPSAGHTAFFGGNQGYDLDPRGPKIEAEIAPAFYAAAWELARRGIIRPGIRLPGEQSTDEGSAGGGFSITPFGAKWLEEAHLDDFIPTEPGRFAEMIETYRDRFGPGFHERAQQAIRCYGAHAYLACCAMVGAATESILLAIAIAKNGESAVMKEYVRASGRAKVEDMVVGQATEPVRREFKGFTTLLKYWRDEAAHGRPSGISDNEAYTSLALMLRFCLFANGHWDELTR